MKLWKSHTFRIHPISTCLFAQSIMLMIMVIASLIWISYEFRTKTDVYIWYVFALSIFIPYLTVCIINSFMYFGLYRINENCVSFYAPFKKSVHIQLETIQYIGIDFGIVSGTRQFWIYFSMKPIPFELIHKIQKIPFNQTFMRIQYSNKKYEELLGFLPENRKKDLIKAATILRVYGYEE